MLSHAFQFVNRVLFDIGGSNFRSQKAMEKIGARLILRTERTKSDGTPYLALTYKIRKSNFPLPPTS